MADELNPQGSPDEVDYEELRRQLMGGGAGQPAAGAPTGTPAPAPNAEPQPPSVGSIIASAGGPKPIPSSIAPATPQPSAIPAPTSNGLPDLISQRAKAGQPIDPRAVDPNTGKPMYKMGIGQRLLGTLANFGSGVAHGGVVANVGPGATNARFGRDVQMQKENTENLDTQIGNTEKLNTEQQNLYNAAMKSAYEQKIAEAKQETAEAQTTKAGTGQELAQIKALAEKDQLSEAKAKLEEQAKRNDEMFKLGQGNLDLKQQLGEMAIQIRQQQLENDRAKFSTGTDAKSLEAERKQRIQSINDDWKQHPYLNKIFSDKNKEIQAVNDDINSRLAGTGVNTGTTPVAGAPQANAAPTPQTHAWSKSGWQAAHPGQDVNKAVSAAQKQGFKVTP